MSTSSCCFLTYIQISQEAGQVVQYSHLFQNFPQFTVIHTVKGFGIVNKAEIDIFLELSCFFDDPADVGNLISGSSALSKTSLNIWKFTVHILLKPVCSVYLLKGRPMGLSSGAHSGVLFIRHIFLGSLPPRSHFSAPHFVSWHYLLPRETTCTWLLGLRSAGGIQFRTGAVENVFQRLDITSGKGAISAQLLSQMILNPLPPSSDFRMQCKRNSRGFRARQPHHWASHFTSVSLNFLFWKWARRAVYSAIYSPKSKENYSPTTSFPALAVSPLSVWLSEVVAKSHFPNPFLSLNNCHIW